MKFVKLLFISVALSFASTAAAFATPLSTGLVDPPGVFSDNVDAAERLMSAIGSNRNQIIEFNVIEYHDSSGVAFDGVFKSVMVAVRYGFETEISFNHKSNANRVESGVSRLDSIGNRAIRLIPD